MKKLNFGCGKDIREKYINVDIFPGEGIDKTFNFNAFPYPFLDNEFDEVYADNVLEHLDDIPRVMEELHRVSKPEGSIRIIVPYYNCYGAYNDVAHKHYFSHLSFEPFYNDKTRANYFIKKSFQLKRIKLVPTRLGRIFVFPIVQKLLSFIFGQIIQSIDVTLIVKK